MHLARRVVQSNRNVGCRQWWCCHLELRRSSNWRWSKFRDIDVPLRKSWSRRKPAIFQMTTPPLSAPNISVARKSCSSQGSSSARPAEFTALFPNRFVWQRRVVRWHEAFVCVVIHGSGSSDFVAMSWAWLKLFTCFSVSHAESDSSAQNSEGQTVFRSLHVCHVYHSLYQNGSIWYGLRNLSCILSLLSSRCGSLSKSTVYRKCLRNSRSHGLVMTVGTTMFQGFREHVFRVLTAWRHIRWKSRWSLHQMKYLIWIKRGNQEGENLCVPSVVGKEASGSTTWREYLQRWVRQRMSCCQVARPFFQGIVSTWMDRRFWLHPRWDQSGFTEAEFVTLPLFLPSTQGQLPACCPFLFVSPARSCVILRFPTSYAPTVVLSHACPTNKKDSKLGPGGIPYGAYRCAITMQGISDHRRPYSRWRCAIAIARYSPHRFVEAFTGTPIRLRHPFQICVSSRHMTDNMFETETMAFSHVSCAPQEPGVPLTDFAAACPSVNHSWNFSVIEKTELPEFISRFLRPAKYL